MKNLTFITGIHGNELAPVFALHTANIPYILANPLANLYGVRYVQKDMNASFGTAGDSYEEVQARKLLKKIDADATLIDFHTMPVASEPFAIIVDLAMLPLAKTLGVKHVVYMDYNPKAGHALINARNGVSVEVGMHGSPESLQRTVKVAHNVLAGKQYPVTLYTVFGEMESYTTQKNFTLFDEKGEKYYPVLAGNRPYNFYGLKATITHQETI